MNVILSMLELVVDVGIVLTLITIIHSFYKMVILLHVAPLELPINGEVLDYVDKYTLLY